MGAHQGVLQVHHGNRPVSLDHVSSPRRPAPPPREGNDQLVTAIITAAWAVAVIVLLVLRDHLPAGDRWWLWTCVAGLGLGIFALWYVPRIKRGRDRGAARRAARAIASKDLHTLQRKAPADPPSSD
jgi:hypothetical protein